VEGKDTFVSKWMQTHARVEPSRFVDVRSIFQTPTKLAASSSIEKVATKVLTVDAVYVFFGGDRPNFSAATNSCLEELHRNGLLVPFSGNNGSATFWLPNIIFAKNHSRGMEFILDAEYKKATQGVLVNHKVPSPAEFARRCTQKDMAVLASYYQTLFGISQHSANSTETAATLSKSTSTYFSGLLDKTQLSAVIKRYSRVWYMLFPGRTGKEENWHAKFDSFDEIIDDIISERVQDQKLLFWQKLLLDVVTPIKLESLVGRQEAKSVLELFLQFRKTVNNAQIAGADEYLENLYTRETELDELVVSILLQNAGTRFYDTIAQVNWQTKDVADIIQKFFVEDVLLHYFEHHFLEGRKICVSQFKVHCFEKLDEADIEDSNKKSLRHAVTQVFAEVETLLTEESRALSLHPIYVEALSKLSFPLILDGDQIEEIVQNVKKERGYIVQFTSIWDNLYASPTAQSFIKNAYEVKQGVIYALQFLEQQHVEFNVLSLFPQFTHSASQICFCRCLF
jgi:hypothetical protein